MPETLATSRLACGAGHPPHPRPHYNGAVSSVAIIGAGPLGGELAFELARRDAVTRIRLIDEHGQVAAGKALDIQQAAPIEGFSTRVIGSQDLAVASDAHVIVLADQFDGREWQTDQGMALLERLAYLVAHRANGTPKPSLAGRVIVCAGARHADLVERGVRELDIPRISLLGSAPEALAAGVRALVALDASCSPADVTLAVLGRPPLHTVILWDQGAIGGYKAVNALNEATRRRVTALADRLWPPGPRALAAAAAKAVVVLLGRSRATITAFVAPDEREGRRERTVARPIRLEPGGLVVEPLTLSARERTALETAMLL